MKQIVLILFFTTVLTYGFGQSGYVSMNLQETRASKNSDVVYPTSKEYYEGMYYGTVNQRITMFNTMDRERNRPYTQAQITQMVKENGQCSLDTLQKKINRINKETNGGIAKSGTTISTIDLRQQKDGKYVWLNWLVNHTTLEYIKFTLQKGDSVYLLGRYGDPAKVKFGYVAYGTNADGYYHVLNVNGEKFILDRAACGNTIQGWQWLRNGKAKIVTEGGDNTTPDDVQPGNDQVIGDDGVEPDQMPNGGGNTKPKTTTKGGGNATNGNNPTMSFVDSSGRVVNIFINNSNKAEGGNVTIGDITAKGGASNNNNNVQGGGDGTTKVVKVVTEEVPAPWEYQDQERYVVTKGVYIDKASKYFQSLGSSNPNNGLGVVGNIQQYLFGNGYNSYAYYYGNGQQYCMAGNWNNGYFQPNYNQCYRYGPNGWSILGSIAAGFFNNLAFCGGYRPQASGPCWTAPNHSGWGYTPRYTVNNYYNNHQMPQVGGPVMGPTIAANGAVNAGGSPHMGYTHP